MPSPRGETEHRKLRALVSASKHYKDAYEAGDLRLIPPEYPSALNAIWHVAHFGYNGDQAERVDTGHAASKPPIYDAVAMRYLAREDAFNKNRGHAALLWLNNHLHGVEAKGDIA